MADEESVEEVDETADSTLLHKPKPKHEVLAVSKLLLDPDLQSRESTSDEAIAEYADAMAAGDEFPPVEVAFDGNQHRVWDGHHTVLGALRAGVKKVNCTVRVGSKRQAFWWSRSANATHGLRRTQADKRAAVDSMLNDGESGHVATSAWSNRRIAHVCKVSVEFVRQRRKSLFEVTTTDGQAAAQHTTDNADDQVFNSDVSNEEPDSSYATLHSQPSPSAAPAVPPTSPPAKPKAVGHIGDDGALNLSDNEPEAPTGPSTPSENDLPLGQWLESLPLSAQLAQWPDSLAIFHQDATSWRDLKAKGLLANLRTAVQSAVKSTEQNGTALGSFTALINRVSRIAHPSQWKRCATCGGSRQMWVARTGGEHLAPGNVVPDGGNQLMVRATKVNCTKCDGGYEL